MAVSIISTLNVSVLEGNSQNADVFQEEGGQHQVPSTCDLLSSCVMPVVWQTQVSVVDSNGAAMAGKLVYLLVAEAPGGCPSQLTNVVVVAAAVGVAAVVDVAALWV